MTKLKLIAVISALVLGYSQQENSGIDLSNFDKSVRPQDDLYRFVNGTWLDKYEIPADKSNYGSFTKLYDEAQENLRTIIEDAAKKNAKKGTDEQKVGDLFASYMDTKAIEKNGLTPLKPYLKKIAAVKTRQDLEDVMVELNKIGVTIPFNFFVAQDAMKSDEYIVNVYQGGLTLPDRNYYVDQGEKNTTIRQKYVDHITKILNLAKEKDGAKKAARILEIETALAEHHWERAANRDRVKTYNKMTVKELDEKLTNFNVRGFLDASGASAAENIRIYQPSFIDGANKVLADVSISDWKNYYTWQLITNYASTLGKAFDDENFAFFATTLRGVTEQSDRWKRAVNTVSGSIGEIVGKVYVEKHFKPEAKERMNTLINNLVVAFEQRINGLAWMSAETKVAAKEKLKKFARKIGYPDVWRDYSALQFTRDNITQNNINVQIWNFNYNMNKLGKPIDRNEWGMTPQTVNAYYSPSKNEIVFPAAILQPPFFNMDADDAVNYGGIGAVIGHELSHGFDDQGAKSDGDGNLRDWWSESDKAQFEALGDRLVAQYNTFEALDSVFVNGRLTLGENIGDLGGLTVAYYAYKNSLNGKKSPVIDGFTGEQRFFIGWAQVWARKYRDEELRNRIVTDSHSPSEFRTNGTVINMPEFQEAFGVKEGDKLYKKPEDIITIW
jgi:predicted metalloendopeptidase